MVDCKKILLKINNNLPGYVAICLPIFGISVSSEFYSTKIENLAMFYITVNMTIRKLQH